MLFRYLPDLTVIALPAIIIPIQHFKLSMSETFSKKEKEKKKDQKRKEKEQRKSERKANSKSGQSLEDMMAYVDENGNISSKPPDLTKKVAINENEIVIGSRNIPGMEVNVLRKGRITYFNTSKGYGFIKDLKTQESIFVHMNALETPVKENDMVSFHTENSVRGLNAVQVKKA
jgi:cold shock CspA family protein